MKLSPPMNRLFQQLLWFLLVPYFAVAELNAPAWIGDTRANTNRANAQLTVSLIFTIAVLGVLGLTDSIPKVDGLWFYIFGLACIVPPWLAIAVWLNRERERHYRAAYRAMSAMRRAAFGIATLAFVAFMWWLALKS